MAVPALTVLWYSIVFPLLKLIIYFQTQQLVGPYWSGGNETPFASIRPVQTRTLAVQPTSLGGVAAAASLASASAGSAALMVPLQQQVHTTGTSGEALSSSPTSSHTDYMPATSSATPIRVVVAPVPLNAQSSQVKEWEHFLGISLQKKKPIFFSGFYCKHLKTLNTIIRTRPCIVAQADQKLFVRKKLKNTKREQNNENSDIQLNCTEVVSWLC